MSWKQSSIIVTIIIVSLITMNLIWDYVVENKNNDEEQNQLPQFAPLYDNHLIRGRVYVSGNPLDKGYAIYYNPKKTNEILVDQQIANGYYEVNLANLPSGWRVGDDGILEINGIFKNQNITIKKTISIDNSPVQIENINVV